MTDKAEIGEKGYAPRTRILPGTTVGGDVGTFSVDLVVSNLSRTQSRTLSAMVDTGASYTVIPVEILEEMGVERTRTRRFVLADGSRRRLSIGKVYLELAGEIDDVNVIFGPDRDTVLLGALALEAFALTADAKHRRLIPTELTM